MQTQDLIKTIFIVALVIPLSNCQAVKADTVDPNIATDAYVSSLPPIYPTDEEQTGKMWGTIEIARCPNGYKLSLESRNTTTGTAPTPACVPMTEKELTGGVQ